MYTGASSKSENVKVRRELKTRRYNYLVGYAIGFPHKDNAVSESILYTVNKMVNYFDKDHEEEMIVMNKTEVEAKLSLIRNNSEYVECPIITHSNYILERMKRKSDSSL